MGLQEKVFLKKMEVEQRLRGRIVRRPKEQVWMLKTDSDMEEYKYTCEPGHQEWTPLNSNLCMQSIKIVENRPIPEKTINNLGSSTEDTLLLLDLMRQKKQQENEQKKMGPQLSWNCKTAASTTG